METSCGIKVLIHALACCDKSCLIDWDRYGSTAERSIKISTQKCTATNWSIWHLHCRWADLDGGGYWIAHVSWLSNSAAKIQNCDTKMDLLVKDFFKRICCMFHRVDSIQFNIQFTPKLKYTKTTSELALSYLTFCVIW